MWKKTDGGHRWSPIFDSENIGSIGAVAVAASDPNVIYVGTGESAPREDVAVRAIRDIRAQTDALHARLGAGSDAARAIDVFERQTDEVTWRRSIVCWLPADYPPWW